MSAEPAAEPAAEPDPSIQPVTSREYVIIAGLSGAGRTTASNVFDDLGWHVIDNLPLQLVGRLAELPLTRVALVLGRDPSEGFFDGDAFDHSLMRLRDGGSRVRVVFLDADDDALVRRYEGTRRRHPLAEHERVAVGIERERQSLDAVQARADVVIDTTELNVHQLRDRLLDLFGDSSMTLGMKVSVVSFGFKHGLPIDVDMVFDVRFLPNPHWVPDLRPLTGLDPRVRNYVLDSEAGRQFLTTVDQLLAVVLPGYVAEGKSYLTIAVGCTGGQHRSVAISEALGRLLTDRGFPPILRHRDLDKR